MTKEDLIESLHRIYPLSDPLREHLDGLLKTRQLKKKEMLLKAGRICECVYFIGKGLVRAYYLKNGDGEAISSWFMKEGDVIFSVESFYDQAPCHEYLQCLEDSTLFYISYKELQSIYRHFAEFNFISRVLTEKYYKQLAQRVREMGRQKAGDRYHYLLRYHPELLSRVPLTMLCSFLGITRRTLTRIRERKN